MFAAAVAIAGAEMFTVATPANAAPGDCQQWGFPGPVTLKMGTGETLNFSANGPQAGAPAKWQSGPDGPTHSGNVNGNIDPAGKMSLTYFRE